MRVLFLIAICLLSLSCERDPVGNNRGPQTTPNDIIEAQNRSLAKLDPYQISMGQRVHFIESQEIISSQGPLKALSKEWVTEVTDVANEPSERVLTTYKTVTDKLWDENFVYVFKGIYSLPQVEALELLDQLDQSRYQLPKMVQQLKERSGAEESEITGVAFHNLIEQEVTIVPPDKVKNSTNCKNLTSCQIKGDRISYDIVFLMANGNTQTHNVEWLISSEVPYFAGILKQCSTSLVPVDTLRVLVKLCNEVVDFDE